MAEKILLTIGMKCPKPLFEISKSMKTIAIDDVLEVHADDPAFKPDIEAWCRRTGHTLLDFRTEAKLMVARVKKTT